MTRDALLEVTDLTVRFGGVTAVDAVSLAVEPGSLVGLIGPNGAGKTTFIDALSGFAPSRGRIVFDGASIERLSPQRRAKRGLARTFQSIELFEDLSVRENVLVAADRSVLGGLTRRLQRAENPARRDADGALHRVGLDDAGERHPTHLAHTDRKLVGIARAIAREPKLLLLDEPAAGLDRRTTEELGERLGALRASGTTLLLVDHDMELVLNVCERVYVLDLGRIIACGAPSEIRADPLVIRAYLGDEGTPP
jgi:branched-chain amino acid transport system ATP-binding protein